jgi:hypothetical protein
MAALAASSFDSGEAEVFVEPVVRSQDGASLLECRVFGAFLGLVEHSPGCRAGDVSRLAFFGRMALSQELGHLRGVSDGQIVFEAQERAGHAGVAHSPGPPGKLAIYSSGFLAIGRHYVQTAEFFDAASEFDIRASSGHVGRYGDASFLSGLGYDLRFLGVADGVQHLVLKLQFGKQN